MNKSKRNSNKISVGDSLKTETFFFNNTSTHEFNKKKFYTPSKTKISKKNIDYHSPSISINQSKKNSIINKLVYNKDKKKVEINNSVNCHSKVFSYKNKTIKKNLNLNINKGLKSKLQYSHLNTINSNQELLTQSNNKIKEKKEDNNKNEIKDENKNKNSIQEKNNEENKTKDNNKETKENKEKMEKKNIEIVTKLGNLKKGLIYKKDFILLCGQLYQIIKNNYRIDYIIKLTKMRTIIDLNKNKSNEEKKDKDKEKEKE